MPTAPPSLPQVSFVNLYSEDPWKKRQRVRIQQACSDCRRQKIKCDGQRPCKACQKAERTCVYAAGPTHHPHPPGTSSTSASASASVSASASASATASASNSHPPTPTMSSTPTLSCSQEPSSGAPKDDDFKVKMEPDESRVPPPLRKDSRKSQNNHHGPHGHAQEPMGDDVKIQIKDIGKYGIPLDEWQKDDSSMSSSQPHPSSNHSRKSKKAESIYI
ncbi:hypothetical protein BGZ52_001543 [Haplosporangium bisporale]|nr:hypothetical protein BGZ52_001543 [Haplosporangium bisporale]KAF9214831.1 hypothetical protein BGZ59_002891 [Podila verticillata]